MKKISKNKFKKLIITLIPILAFLFVVWLLILGLNSYINNASYFKIKKIILNGLEDKKLAQQISRNFLYDNIFSLDINRVKGDLKKVNPQFYEVEIIKNFPDQLVINVLVRRPLAQIEQKGYFLIDKDSVIVSDESYNPFDDFMIISGLNNIPSLSFGKKINTQQLNSGLRLVNGLKDIRPQLIPLMPRLLDGKIKVELSKYPSIYVYFDKLELRFYEESLDMALKSLIGLLSSISKDTRQVEYIDLRFAEPAVSFKNEK